MAIKISATQLSTFQECPYKYYLAYIAKVKPPRWIKFLFGAIVHQTIARFYSLDERNRLKRVEKGSTELFPQSKESAINIWHWMWSEALKGEKANPKIIHNPGPIRYDPVIDPKEQAEKLRRLGASMIGKYWEDNHHAPFPLAVEFRFEVPAPGRSDVTLIGSIDQIREIEGKLWIIDLKTSWEDYGVEDSRIQYAVHNETQFTLYSWAFRMMWGKEEAGIIRYPLGFKKCPITGNKIDKKAIITPRDIENYVNLATLIEYFLFILNKGIFPKFFGRHCQFCDYLDFCAKNKITTTPVPTSQLFKAVDPNKIRAQLEEATQSLPRIKRPRLL